MNDNYKIVAEDDLSYEELKRLKEKAKDTTFKCLICGRTHKGIVLCDHGRSEKDARGNKDDE
jgi:hypothetical protein